MTPAHPTVRSTMNCEWLRENAALLLYGELSMEEEERAEAHAAQCDACRHTLAQQRQIHALLDEAPLELPASLLTDCRRGLQASLQQQQKPSFRMKLNHFFGADAWIWKPVAACALVAVGFYASKWQTQREIMDAMANAPAGELRLVRTTADGEVEIAYETAQRKTVRGHKDDPAIQGLMLRAAREAEDDGARLATVEALRSQPQTPEVQETLLSVAQRDPSPTVRAKAVTALKEYAGEMVTRRGLVQVLRHDADTAVRAQAIDLILLHTAPSRFDAEMIGGLQETVRREDNGDVRQKCVKVLTLVNASPGIY